MIPIRNIYYMLSYAYDILNEGDNQKLSDEEFENIYDLFGKILVNGLDLLIKRGFHREYIYMSEELPAVRGKIDINRTIKKQQLILGKLNCEFDELSENALPNKIIKTTINNLIGYKGLDSKIREQLIRINRFFQGIEIIQLKKSDFSHIQYRCNNRFYKLIIDICELLFEEMIVTEQKGVMLFKDFLRDNRMAKLYEKFILNFYKKELPRIHVYSPKINWNIDTDFDHIGINYLPDMRTDIVLETKQKQLIIDAKYYAHSLQMRGDVGEVKKLISANLYQIFTYVNNSSFEGETAGMLIYPVTEMELDCEYSMKGKKISVKTLNLNNDWMSINARLLELPLAIFEDY